MATRGDKGVLEVASMPHGRASSEDGALPREGEMPQALAGHERIAAEDDGDVVMPTAEGASSGSVEPELSRRGLGMLGAPSVPW